MLFLMSLNSTVKYIKMYIQPKLIDLFQTLPVEEPTQQSVEWDKLISRFLWQV